MQLCIFARKDQILLKQRQLFWTSGQHPLLSHEPKQILQGMVGRTNFPPTILFLLLLLNIENLLNFNRINS